MSHRTLFPFFVLFFFFFHRICLLPTFYLPFHRATGKKSKRPAPPNAQSWVAKSCAWWTAKCCGRPRPAKLSSFKAGGGAIRGRTGFIWRICKQRGMGNERQKGWYSLKEMRTNPAPLHSGQTKMRALLRIFKLSDEHSRIWIPLASLV